MQMATVQWFMKCGLTAAVLLLACGLATARFGHGLQLPSTTTRDGSLITLNRYATEPIPDVVLVGSSLTFRLKEEYFATTKLRNLALAGGSPVTGLEIVANQPRLPKIILVETNVLSRATDEVLVGRYSSKGNAEPLFFRPVRSLVAAYENWRHAPVTQAQAASAHARLLQQPPSDFDNRVYVDRAVREANTEDPTIVTQINVQRLQQLIAALEQRGARCCFSSFRWLRNWKMPGSQEPPAISFMPGFPIPVAGCRSTSRAASCGGPTGFIWMSDPRLWSGSRSIGRYHCCADRATGRHQRAVQQRPERERRYRHRIIGGEQRMGQEEDDVDGEVCRYDEGDFALPAPPCQRRPSDCNQQQRKLQVDQIRSQHHEIQRRRDRVGAAIGGRKSDFPH